MVTALTKSYFWIIVGALCLAGCQGSDPGLEEKLTRAEAELETKKREISEANKQIEELKKELETARSTLQPPAEAPPAQAVNTSQGKPIDPDLLEEGYVNAARSLQRKLEQSLSAEYQIKSFTLHSVEIAPQVTTPYSSRLQISFVRKSDSTPLHLDLPVGADYSGEWKFPSLEDISKSLAAGGTPPVQETKSASVPTQPTAPQTPVQPTVDPNVVNISPGAPTIIFNWDNSETSARPPQSEKSPQPTAATPSQAALPQFVMPEPIKPPSQPEIPAVVPGLPPATQPPPSSPSQAPAAEPTKVMPTDRDVIIQF